MRWVTFNDSGMPGATASTATAVAVSVFNLSGLVNAVLILSTRTNVLLLGSGAISNESSDQPDQESMDTQELGRYTGLSRTPSHRHRIQASTENRVPDMSSVPTSPVADTGFGGPVVRLRFDDSDSEDGGLGADGLGGPHGRRIEARDIDMSSSAGHGMIGGVSLSAGSRLSGQNLIPAKQRTEIHSPGREYLESLGVRPPDRPAE